MSQIQAPRAPNLPEPPLTYSPGFVSQHNNVLRLFFNQITNALQQLLLGFNNYGTFYDTTTQTAALANTAYPLQLNTTAEHFGIDAVGTPPTRITVTRDGVYNFQFSAQLDNLGGGVEHAHFWFRVNGVDVAHSASKVTVNGPNDEGVPAWNYLITLHAGDYFELMWAVSSTNVVLQYLAAAAPVPAIPSLIMTATYMFPNSAV